LTSAADASRNTGAGCACNNRRCHTDEAGGAVEIRNAESSLGTTGYRTARPWRRCGLSSTGTLSHESYPGPLSRLAAHDLGQRIPLTCGDGCRRFSFVRASTSS
jgi:hypothetical protein